MAFFNILLTGSTNHQRSQQSRAARRLDRRGRRVMDVDDEVLPGVIGLEGDPDSAPAGPMPSPRRRKRTTPPAKANGTPIQADVALLSSLGALVEPLATALDGETEVVLHDLTRIPNSIIAISGNVTGRSIGAPMTDLLLRKIRQGETENVLRYHTKTPDGRDLRSSTMFIRNASGIAIACLCLNSDITPWKAAHSLLGDFIDGNRQESPQGVSDKADGSSVEEKFASTVEELTVTLLNQVIDSTDVPVHLMQKVHKMEVVRQLEERGVFLIRDSIDYVAVELHVSRCSIYNYLNELDRGGRRTAERRRARFRRLQGGAGDDSEF